MFCFLLLQKRSESIRKLSFYYDIRDTPDHDICSLCLEGGIYFFQREMTDVCFLILI